MRFDADAASAALWLREAKQQRHRGIERYLLRPCTVAPWASGRPPRRLTEAMVSGRGSARLLLSNRSHAIRERAAPPVLPQPPPRTHRLAQRGLWCRRRRSQKGSACEHFGGSDGDSPWPASRYLTSAAT